MINYNLEELESLGYKEIHNFPSPIKAKVFAKLSSKMDTVYVAIYDIEEDITIKIETYSYGQLNKFRSIANFVDGNFDFKKPKEIF